MKTSPRCPSVAVHLAFFVLPLVALARVGETEAALTKAHGEPVERAQENVMVKGKLLPSFPKLTYRTPAGDLVCVLVDGTCVKASYVRDGVWPDEDYARILADNAQGKSWEIDAKGSKLAGVKRTWNRSDGATALWRKNLGLTIETPAFVAAAEAVKRDARNNVKVLPKD